ncbi:MAG: LuxR C-terminal-related transcriptional regulator [Bacteroidota bacterium]
MPAHIESVRSIWEKYPPDLGGKQSISFQKEEFLEKLGKIYSPGPFFFMVFNFVTYEVIHSSPSIYHILGLKPKEWTLKALLERLHPQDQEHFQTCERFVGEFLFNFLPPDQILSYKSLYYYRLRRKDGVYIQILQQAMPINLDANNRVITSFVTHTDVTQTYGSPNRKLSLLSLAGGTNYLGIDPYEGMHLKTKKSYSPLTDREIQVLGFLAEGNSLEEIGARLFISKDTVRTHRNNIRKKMQCRKTSQAIVVAIREGWL